MSLQLSKLTFSVINIAVIAEFGHFAKRHFSVNDIVIS